MDQSESAAFLFGSWKAFLVVLSSDQPITVSPKTCQRITACLIKAIREQLNYKQPGKLFYLVVAPAAPAAPAALALPMIVS